MRKRRLRRGGGRWRGWASGLCVLVALAGLAVLLVGRVATDARHWTQYLWWVPAGWCVVWAWGWLGLSRVLSQKRRVVRRVGVVGAALASVFVVVGVWRVHRAVLGGSERGDLRVAHWNVSSAEIGVDTAGDALRALDADVVCVANARWGGDRRAIADRVAGGGEGVTVLMRGQSVVVSRLPVAADVVVYFGWSGEDEEGVRVHGHRGWVHMLALDAGGERPVVVWVVDMPSEPTRWRMETARLAVDAVEGENVRARVLVDGVAVGIGELRRVDLMVGDFNTPRGSASLGVFDRFARSGGLVDAHAQVGWGVRGSWTTDQANVLADALFAMGSWHIDLALVDTAHAAVGYRLVGVGRTDHLAQVVDLDLE